MAMSIPWGDVATAFFSTGIPNIIVYIPRSLKGINKIKKQRKWLFILKFKFVQNYLKNKMKKKIINGADSDEQRAKSKMWVWAEVKNKEGKTESGYFQVGNGYDVTGYGAMLFAKNIMENTFTGGYYTPSLLLGPSIVEKLPGFSGIKFSNS